MPQGQGLGAGQFQITDTRGAEAKPPVASETPQMAGVQPQVTGVSGESVIPVSAPQSSEVNPYQFGVTKLGEFEAGLIGGIGSELRGISELGYSIDSKIIWSFFYCRWFSNGWCRNTGCTTIAQNG
jgi:hypothetical protein